LLANSLNVTVSHVLLQYKNNVKNDKIICVLKFYVKRVKYQFVFYLNTVNNFLKSGKKSCVLCFTRSLYPVEKQRNNLKLVKEYLEMVDKFKTRMNRRENNTYRIKKLMM
jgi:hypothetical protein